MSTRTCQNTSEPEAAGGQGAMNPHIRVWLSQDGVQTLVGDPYRIIVATLVWPRTLHRWWTEPFPEDGFFGLVIP